jgi:hypothetical protein
LKRRGSEEKVLGAARVVFAANVQPLWMAAAVVELTLVHFNDVYNVEETRTAAVSRVGGGEQSV